MPGNTAAPVIMVGERAADFIIKRYQRSKNQPQQPDFNNRFDSGETGSRGNYASNEDNTNNNESNRDK